MSNALVAAAADAPAVVLGILADRARQVFFRRAWAERLNPDGELLSTIANHFNFATDPDYEDPDFDVFAVLAGWVSEIYGLGCEADAAVQAVVKQAVEAAEEAMMKEEKVTEEVPDGDGGTKKVSRIVRTKRYVYQGWLLHHGARACRKTIVETFGEPDISGDDAVIAFMSKLHATSNGDSAESLPVILRLSSRNPVDALERRVFLLAQQALNSFLGA